MLSLRRRTASCALLALPLLCGMLVTAGAGAGGARERAPARTAPARTARQDGQALVTLLGDHVVRAAPRAQARRIGWVAGRRPLRRVHTVLPVLGRAGAWVHVR